MLILGHLAINFCIQSKTYFDALGFRFKKIVDIVNALGAEK